MVASQDNPEGEGNVIFKYTDEQAIRDGVLADITFLQIRAPNNKIVNRATASIAERCLILGSVYDPRKVAKIIEAANLDAGDGWFKGFWEGDEIWLVPNEVGGMTVMFPSDY